MRSWQRCAAALLLAGAVSVTGTGVQAGFAASAAPVASPPLQSERVHRHHQHPQHQRWEQHGRLLELAERDPERAQQVLTRLHEKLSQQLTRVQESIQRLEQVERAEKAPARKAVLAAEADVMRARASLLAKRQTLVRKLLELAAEQAKARAGQ